MIRTVTTRRIIVCISFLLVTNGIVIAQSRGNQTAFFSTSVMPGVEIPVGSSGDLFTLGGGAFLSGRAVFPMIPLLYLSIDAGYSLVPLRAAPALSVLSTGGSYGLNYLFSPKLQVTLFGCTGFYYGILDDGYETSGAGGLYQGGGLEFSFFLNPSISLGAGALYRSCLGLLHSLRFSAAASYHIDGKQRNTEVRDGYLLLRPDPLKGKRLEISDVTLEPIYPVFYSYYDDHSLGSVTLKNSAWYALENVEVSLFIPRYMDNPKECPSPGTIDPDEERTVELFALLTDRILEITEGTKLTTEILVTYLSKDRVYEEKRVVTAQVNGRNTLTWDDDRKAAAFVTAKDPVILKLAKTINAELQDQRRNAIDGNLVTSIGVLRTMGLYGLSYAVDPSTPYAELSTSGDSVDFVQFPRQTLDYKSGDCDDLSILFSSLLEALGIETAFVTVPGHIFVAFALEMDESAARRSFASHEELIFREGEVWIPVEVTELRGSFMRAWESGARQWREAETNGTGGFYPVRSAWQEFKAVGYAEEETELILPDPGALSTGVRKDMQAILDRELYPKIAALNDMIRANNNDPNYVNRLGVLYARYGMLDKAEAEFLRVLSRKRDYLSTLLNLGNLYLLSEKPQVALSYFEKASKQDPYHPAVLLGLARTYHQLESYDRLQQTYSLLKASDPELASRFAYLGSGSDSSGRAAQSGADLGRLLWKEEDE
jgi:hypothetical protein